MAEPSVPLLFVATEDAGVCDPVTGVCAAPATAAETATAEKTVADPSVS